MSDLLWKFIYILVMDLITDDPSVMYKNNNNWIYLLDLCSHKIWIFQML